MLLRLSVRRTKLRPLSYLLRIDERFGKTWRGRRAREALARTAMRRAFAGLPPSLRRRSIAASLFLQKKQRLAERSRRALRRQLRPLQTDRACASLQMFL